ncbi:MAG: hypothetical protein OZ921_12030 [Sorangiineae bacterium]|nr:hypothetical protein [Polyangiaceae bacterium]MEB2323233.1 hypothetical protein [Sorangiineae bacterium]
MRSFLGLACVFAAFTLAACGVNSAGAGGSAGDTGSGGGAGSGAGGAGGNGAGGNGAGGNGAGGNTSGGGGSFNLAGAGGTSGSPEVCDGVDNDGNGIVDDVDVGGDGVCDCLLIATLGVPGTWGQGDVFATWLDSRSDVGAVSLNAQLLTRELLEKYDVVVAEDLSKMGRGYSPAEVQALADWVRAGGGLMTLIGYADPSEIANANLLLGAYGMSYGSQQILAKPDSTSTVPITQWVAHPVTDGITRIGVDNGYPVNGGTTLATEQGWNVLAVSELSKGHVLMWGDEWITYNSEWSEHPDYQVERFWLNAIKWLTRESRCQVPIPPK